MAITLQLETLSGPRRREAEAAWRRVERYVGQGVPLACSWDWTTAWLDQYADAVPYSFVVASRDGEPTAAALIVESRSTAKADLGLRRLHVGTFGEPGPGGGVFTEYNGLLARPQERAEFAARLVEHLEQRSGWDELRFDAMPLDDIQAVQVAQPGLVVETAASPYRCLATVREAGGDVLASLRKGPRSRARRSLRGLGDDLEISWADSADDLSRYLDELIELHERRWKAEGLAGAFADPRVSNFHREVAARLLGSRRVMLCRVRASGSTIACVLGYVDRGRLLFYQSGIARHEDSRVNVAVVAHLLCMEQCLARGLDAYDFLVGDSRYKRELADGEALLAWAAHRRRTGRSLAAAGIRKVARRPATLAPVD